jgi:hypothetical protein
MWFVGASASQKKLCKAFHISWSSESLCFSSTDLMPQRLGLGDYEEDKGLRGEQDAQVSDVSGPRHVI